MAASLSDIRGGQRGVVLAQGIQYWRHGSHLSKHTSPVTVFIQIKVSIDI